MLKTLLASLVLMFTSYPAMSSAQTAKVICKGEQAGEYALAVANIQYARHGAFANKPFTLKETKECSRYYFKEHGLDQRKIKKENPIEVYQVILQSVDEWECIYYVTLSIAKGRKCDFNSISFHFCSK